MNLKVATEYHLIALVAMNLNQRTPPEMFWFLSNGIKSVLALRTGTVWFISEGPIQFELPISLRFSYLQLIQRLKLFWSHFTKIKVSTLSFALWARKGTFLFPSNVIDLAYKSLTPWTLERTQRYSFAIHATESSLTIWQRVTPIDSFPLFSDCRDIWIVCISLTFIHLE